MEEMNIMRKKQYLMNISNHLCSLIKQAENYYRSNRFGSLKKVEGILCGLLNLLNGWNLIPIDDDDEKMSIFCQINQMDQDQHIALEIIYDNALSKLNSSLSRFPNHWTDMSYHALIVSNEKLPDSVGALPNKSWFSYKSNVWTASKVQSILQNNFAVDFIGNISDYLDEAVRLISKPFKSHVPLLPSLPLHGASFLPRTRVAELKVLKKASVYKSPLFLWGPAGIGKTELAIQLGKELAPKNGAYFLHFKKPQNKKDGVMTETILNASFSDHVFLHNDRDQAFNERIEVLRQKYSDALLIVDGFDIPGMTFDEIKKDPTFQAFVSLQKCNLQLVFTTRNAINENGFEVKHLSEQNLINILRDSYPDDATTNELWLELLRIVDFNTLVVTLMSQILFVSNGDITPYMLMDAFLCGNLNRYNFPKIVSDQNNSYRLDTFAGHLQKLFDFSSYEKSTYCAIICSAFLPKDGMNESAFLQCLPTEAQQSVRYLLEVHLLYYHGEKIYAASLFRQVCYSISAHIDEYCDVFFDSLWNFVNLRTDDKNLITQKAKCLSMAVDMQISYRAKYAIYAGRLWMLAGNKQMALHYYIQAATFQRELESPNSLILASCYFDIADVFLQLGKHGIASEYALLALNLLKTSLPPLDPDLATAYFDASAYLIKDSNYAEALNYMQSGLLIREKILSETHPDTAISYFQIGEVYFSLKDYVSSLQYYEKALPLLKKSIPINYDLINRINPQIDKTRFLVERKSRIDVLQGQLDMQEPQQNYEDDVQAEVYYEIATCYMDLGEYQNALDNYLVAIELFPYRNIHAKRRTASAVSEIYRLLNNAQKASEYENYANSDDEYFFFSI